MKKCIIVLNHLSKDDILYHYNWHKQMCDCKVVWQTDQKTDHSDIYTIDVPGKIIIPNVMRILCHYAAKFDYDYYCIMAGDCFILKKDFFDNGIKLMVDKKADVCFTHLSNTKEHYKSLFDTIITRKYRVPQTQIRWTLNVCNIVSKKGIEIYNKFSYSNIYDEADFPNVFFNRCRSIIYPDIDYNYFNAAAVASKHNDRYGDRIKSIVNEKEYPKIIHAVKSYEMLNENGIKLI